MYRTLPACVAFVCAAFAVTINPATSRTTLHRDFQPLSLTPHSYSLSVFASGTTSYSKPDAIVVQGAYVYIAYQNKTKKNGSDHKPSTIVQYTRSGGYVQAFNIIGHCDGLRFDPYSGELWALVNNDANPLMYTINPVTQKVTAYHFSSVPHGGGYDDLAFTGGKAFISASNPNLNGAGVNTYPAVDSVRLVGNVAQLTPVLYGNARALDTTTNKTVTLNEVDPDSMSVDPQGDVVLVNQGGMELVFLHNPGTTGQSVTRVPVPTQLEDTVWATGTAGCLYIVDGAANTTYRTSSTSFTLGTVFTQAPADSSVASFVGTLDLRTGFVTPVITGLKSPTGLLFVPRGF